MDELFEAFFFEIVDGDVWGVVDIGFEDVFVDGGFEGAGGVELLDVILELGFEIVFLYH